MANLVVLVTLPLVLAVAHAILGESVEDVALVLGRLSLDPALEVRPHLALDARVVVVEVGVVEALEDLVRDVVGVDRGVLPRLDDGLHGVSDDDCSDLSSGLVQDENEAAKREGQLRDRSDGTEPKGRTDLWRGSCGWGRTSEGY